MKLLWLLSTSIVLLAWGMTSLLYEDTIPHVNYDSTIYFNHTTLRVPSTKDEIVELVKFAASNDRKIRVVGSGHSWSQIATTEDILVSLYNYTGVVSVNEGTKEVTVRAGTTLKELNRLLDERGLAMRNLGSVSEQTIAGAISTGTHGTGVVTGNMATFVTKMELVTGTGETVTASKDHNPDLLKAAQISLGMFGIITEVTIQCDDKFNLEETLTVKPIGYCIDNAKELAYQAQHVKLWLEVLTGKCGAHFTNRTDEQPRDNDRIIPDYKYKLGEAISWVISWLETYTRPAFKFILKRSGFFGSRNRVNVSYNVFNIPNYTPVHSEAEIVVEIENCTDAIRELERVVIDYNIPLNLPIEVRFVQADDVWLSPDYQRDSCHITYALYNARKEVRLLYFNEGYKATRKFGARVHWGKHFDLTPDEVKRLYPKFDDFAAVRAKHDPKGVFMNGLLQKTFGF